jgi:hypothetical protein
MGVTGRPLNQKPRFPKDLRQVGSARSFKKGMILQVVNDAQLKPMAKGQKELRKLLFSLENSIYLQRVKLS